MASGGSGVKTDALGSYGAANNNAGTQYGALAPQFAQMASGNDGLTPQQKAGLLTSSAQSLGGSTAGIVGQGALEEQRTGNAGSYGAVADAAARSAMQGQSAASLGVQNESDQIARQNQLTGLQGEQGLFNTETGSAQNYLNLANQSKPSFLQQLGGAATGDVLSAITGGVAKKVFS